MKDNIIQKHSISEIKNSGTTMENLLTPKQLSLFLQVAVSTIYKWTHYGYVPHCKIGGNVRFDIKQIERWRNKLSKKGRNTYRLDASLP